MKKFLSLFLALLLLLPLAACGGGEKDGKIQVVCTSFAAYDWVRVLTAGRADRYEITYLLDNGIDIHSYEPSTADVARIADCDLFLYVGGAAEDAWVSDVLALSGDGTRRDLSLLSLLGDAVICLDGDAHDHADHAHASDEHVWLSLKNAQVLCTAIADALSSLDPDGAAVYDESLDGYLDALGALDLRYAEAVAAAKTDTLVLADRHPFRYLARDYGLSVVAAFDGCTTDATATFETPIRLAQAIDQGDIHTVLILDHGDDALARTAISHTATGDQSICSLTSLQSVKKSELDGTLTNLSAMEENLAVLTAALN